MELYSKIFKPNNRGDTLGKSQFNVFQQFYVSGFFFQFAITFLDQRFQSQNSSYNYQNETMWPDYYTFTFSGSQFVPPLYLIRWDNAKRITQLHACCIIAIHDVTQSVIQSQNSSIITERPCDQMFTHFFLQKATNSKMPRVELIIFKWFIFLVQ